MSDKEEIEMSDEVRLFGLPGAEELYLSVVEVYEHVIENRYEKGETVEVEEWTVADNRIFFPTAETVIENVTQGWLVDTETNEFWWEDAANRSLDEDVQQAFQDALNLWADKLKYKMADRCVASHSVVTGDNPTVDGAPMYRKVQS